MKLAKQSVELVDHMGSDLSVVNAARVSFDKLSEWQYDRVEGGVGIKRLSDKDIKLIQYLARHKHWTPFAHALVSFRLRAPIFVARQLVKHQVGLVWNEVSRRYVESEPEFYIPDSWRSRADNVKQGSGEVLKDLSFDIPDVLLEYLQDSLSFYNILLGEGVAPEQARMVLPLNTMTEWIWTGSLMAWARVCKLRLDPHAQKETQDIAHMISDHMKRLFPYSWSELVV